MKKQIICLIALFCCVFSIYAQNEPSQNINWKVGDNVTYQMKQTHKKGENEEKLEFKIELKVLQVAQDGYKLQSTFSLLNSPEIELKADDFGKKIMELMQNFIVSYQVNQQGVIISDFDAGKTFVTKEEALVAITNTTTNDGEKFTIAIFRDLMTKEKMLPVLTEILKTYHSLYGINHSKKQKITRQDSIVVNYRPSKAITLPATSITETAPMPNQVASVNNTTTLTDFTLAKQLLEKVWGDMIKYYPPPTIKKAENKTQANINLQTMFINTLTSQKEQLIDKKLTTVITELKIQQ